MKNQVEQQNTQDNSLNSAVSSQKTWQTSNNKFVDNRAKTVTQRQLQTTANNSPQVQKATQLQAMANQNSAKSPVQKQSETTPNKTGLPDQLKSGIENLSGYSMDDVKVHRNSSKPAQLKAHAYAQGSNIHLGPGQEKHLPHEAWHVAQQKQGRVKPTMQMKGKVNVNDDNGLEKEADIMGQKAMKQGSDSTGGLKDQKLTSQGIAQRKKVPTNFGEFETTQLDNFEDRGVEITLKFHPNEEHVDAKKIALIQTLRKTTASGDPYAIDPNQVSKMVPPDQAGGGYTIDAPASTNNPIYWGAQNLGEEQDLKDTPQNNNPTANPTELGVNANYEIGHCYKKAPEDAAKDKHSAGLWDQPKAGKAKGNSKIFETTALATDGADKGTYYGSVKWGYKIEGSDEAPTLTMMDIEEASKGNPTENFVESAKMWNAGTTQGTLKVTADPATVLKGDGSGETTLAKDTKVKQLATVVWAGNPSLKAEVLAADGSATGTIVYIKNADLVDMGDGQANKQIPLPE